MDFLDPVKRPAALAEFKADWENYRWAQEQGNSLGWQRFLARSPFRTMPML